MQAIVQRIPFRFFLSPHCKRFATFAFSTLSIHTYYFFCYKPLESRLQNWYSFTSKFFIVGFLRTGTFSSNYIKCSSIFLYRKTNKPTRLPNPKQTNTHKIQRQRSLGQDPHQSVRCATWPAGHLLYAGTVPVFPDLLGSCHLLKAQASHWAECSSMWVHLIRTVFYILYPQSIFHSLQAFKTQLKIRFSKEPCFG